MRLIGLAIVLILSFTFTPFTTEAQDHAARRTARIGRLSPLSAVADAPNLAAFRKGLRDLGWVEGRDFTIEARFAEGSADRLPELAVELTRRQVDVILAGSNQGAVAAKKATNTIPIVMVTTGDPVEGKLVASLARPGGNLTGVTALGQVLSTKRLELLKKAVPGVSSVAVRANPTSPYTEPFLRDREGAARSLGIHLRVLEAHDHTTVAQAFAAMAKEHSRALMVLTDVMFINHRKRIVELAAKNRLPAVYGERQFVEVGGLMFYGASLVDMYNRAAVYADKILKGTKPADLPIEQPTKLELVINMKTAKALGLTIPPTVLLQADQIIE
jgi:ABC-type uncharacterized transport system substrate-binding protein